MKSSYLFILHANLKAPYIYNIMSLLTNYKLHPERTRTDASEGPVEIVLHHISHHGCDLWLESLDQVVVAASSVDCPVSGLRQDGGTRPVLLGVTALLCPALPREQALQPDIYFPDCQLHVDVPHGDLVPGLHQSGHAVHVDVAVHVVVRTLRQAVEGLQHVITCGLHPGIGNVHPDGLVALVVINVIHSVVSKTCNNVIERDTVSSKLQLYLGHVERVE